MSSIFLYYVKLNRMKGSYLFRNCNSFFSVFKFQIGFSNSSFVNIQRNLEFMQRLSEYPINCPFCLMCFQESHWTEMVRQYSQRRSGRLGSICVYILVGLDLQKLRNLVLEISCPRVKQTVEVGFLKSWARFGPAIEIVSNRGF